MLITNVMSIYLFNTHVCVYLQGLFRIAGSASKVKKLKVSYECAVLSYSKYK